MSRCTEIAACKASIITTCCPSALAGGSRTAAPSLVSQCNGLQKARCCAHADIAQAGQGTHHTERVEADLQWCPLALRAWPCRPRTAGTWTATWQTPINEGSRPLQAEPPMSNSAPASVLKLAHMSLWDSLMTEMEQCPSGDGTNTSKAAGHV